MKQFFKMVFASLTAIIIAGILFPFIILTSVVGLSMGSTTYIPKKNSVLHLKLSGSIQERAENNILNTLLGSEEKSIGLNDLLKAIETAQTDDHITGIYIEPSGMIAGYATIEELRNALQTFKSKGKFVIAYGDNFTQKEYYLASIADQLFLNPAGMLDFKGLTAEHTFYKKALDKLGIDMQIFKVGTYKSAVEPFIDIKMSEANREQTQVYLKSMWDVICNDIARSRDLTTDTLNMYADRMVAMLDNKEYLEMGLIDNRMYRHEVLTLLTVLSGNENADAPQLVTPEEINTFSTPNPPMTANIAIVYAAGEIVGSSSNLTEEAIHTEELIDVLTEIGKDDDIKAVVLRVNSPGGSAFGSEQIWATIEQLKIKKPVVVSMGDYAASGGYYIACNANRIFAQPTTLTGSIGIFGMIPNAEKLLTDKLGLTFDEVRTNKYGNFPSLHSALTEDEKIRMQRYVDRGYELFVDRCATGRRLSDDSIRKLAEGRVWSGSNAIDLGLVDELGGKTDALNWVANQAGLKEIRIAEYPHKKSLYEELLAQFGTEMKAKILQSFLGEETQYYHALRFIRNFDPIQARTEIFDLR